MEKKKKKKEKGVRPTHFGQRNKCDIELRLLLLMSMVKKDLHYYKRAPGAPKQGLAYGKKFF